MKDRYSYVIHFKSETHLLSLPNSFMWMLAGFSCFHVGLKPFLATWALWKGNTQHGRWHPVE